MEKSIGEIWARELSPGAVLGDVGQKHQSYFLRSSFRIDIAIAAAPTPKWGAISAMDIPMPRKGRSF